MATDAMTTRVAAFDANLLTRLNDENFVVDIPNNVFYLQDNDSQFKSPDFDPNIPLEVEYGDMLQLDKIDADNVEFETFDRYIGAKFLVNQNGESAPARVIKRARDNTGWPVGKSNANPLLDTREYEFVLEDGSTYRYNANVIAENNFAQCDDEGCRHAVLNEIIDHMRDRTAIDITNGYVTMRKGK